MKKDNGNGANPADVGLDAEIASLLADQAGGDAHDLEKKPPAAGNGGASGDDLEAMLKDIPKERAEILRQVIAERENKKWSEAQSHFGKKLNEREQEYQRLIEQEKRIRDVEVRVDRYARPDTIQRNDIEDARRKLVESVGSEEGARLFLDQFERNKILENEIVQLKLDQVNKSVRDLKSRVGDDAAFVDQFKSEMLQDPNLYNQFRSDEERAFRNWVIDKEGGMDKYLAKRSKPAELTKEKVEEIEKKAIENYRNSLLEKKRNSIKLSPSSGNPGTSTRIADVIAESARELGFEDWK